MLKIEKKILIYLNSCHYLQAQYKFEPTGCKDLTPEDVARAVVYAASQPYYVAVNQRGVSTASGTAAVIAA